MRHEDYASMYIKKKKMNYVGNYIEIHTTDKTYSIFFDGVAENDKDIVLVEYEPHINRNHILNHIIDSIYVDTFYTSRNVKLVFITPSINIRILKEIIKNEVDLIEHFIGIDTPEISVEATTYFIN